MFNLASFFNYISKKGVLMKTRIILYGILVAFMLQSCVSANYYLKQGNYEAAIQQAVAKLRKHPKKADKHILALETAWKIETQKINDRIDYLKLEGKPEAWVEIHELYAQLDRYQKAVKPYLPLYIKKEYRNADIQIIDVNQALIDAKMKAAQFMYAKGDELLANQNKASSREAYYHFLKVKEYYGNFQDVDSKINEAYQKGQNHVLIGYSNHSQMIIPQAFMNNISQYDERVLDGEWTKYHKDQNARENYDYVIEVHITQVNIGPEQVNNTSYTDSKEIEDGFEYVLDANGNVTKDSLGNDIKIPAIKQINANVFVTQQKKAGTIAGLIEYRKAKGGVFESIPFQENLLFSNQFATYKGDKRALSKESKQLIGGQPLGFPTDIQMVMDVSEIIKNKTISFIQQNQELVMY